MNAPMRYRLSILCAVLFVFGFATHASAQTIDVTFESDPLFVASTSDPIIPGDTITRWFSVTNAGGDTQTVYIRTLNDTETNDLADALLVSVRNEENVEVYAGQLSDLFSRDNKSDSPPLEDILSGATRTYDLSVTFAPQAGNTYQNGTAQFDLCIGFAGGNENCITGTGDPDDNNGGGGGGGGGNNDDNPDDDDDLPPGLIAGAATSTGPFQSIQNFVRPFADFVRGTVLGESTSTDEEAATTTEGTTFNKEPERTSTATALLMDETFCTFWWLLLLALISFGWSAFEDWYRHGAGVFRDIFLRNAVFTAAYAGLLFLFQVLGWLAGLWWVFVRAGVIATIVDYRAHAAIVSIALVLQRNIYFGAMGALFILTSFFFGFPCATNNPWLRVAR